MMPTTFQDRAEIISKICAPTDPFTLFNIYGEAGIGKSRLLAETALRLRAQSPPALVLQVDLTFLEHVNPDEQPIQVLRELITQAQGRLNDKGQNAEQLAGEIVTQVHQLVKYQPVYLIFDTTEVLQENMEFWRWLEEYLVGPLVVEGQARQIFAGRVPVPWRRVEVRREVRLERLTPLPTHNDAQNLVREVLQGKKQKSPNQSNMDKIIDLVLELSWGHPLLSEELAGYVARHWPVSLSAEFKRDLCNKVVKPFIDEKFLKSVDFPWDKILWWTSALDWFDVTILQEYLKRVEPDLTQDKPDYFFIQGITRLRLRNTVVWREERGDRLHGVIGDIMRHCFEVLEPTRYNRACQAAADTLQTLAAEFPEDDPEAQQYRYQAKIYHQRQHEEDIP